MIHYGVSFFMLEKLGAVVGVSNLHIYAAMRGEALETFLQTRNAPGALYSVAGRDDDGARPACDEQPATASPPPSAPAASRARFARVVPGAMLASMRNCLRN